MRAKNNSWFLQLKPNPAARLRLFCFPYAGGNASLFESWKNAFDGVDVVAVQMPGCNNRFNEKPLESVERIVEQLIPEFDDFYDIPFAFFGHSNGALICFEVARELQRRGVNRLVHIFLSAKRAPHLPPLHAKSYDLPYDQFIDKLRSINGTPETVLVNKELMDLLLPVLRADFKVSETHNYIDDIKLKTSASLFSGILDTNISQSDIMAWQANIDSDDIQHTAFPGDHFFIHTQNLLLIETINKTLRRLLHTHIAREHHEVAI